MNSDNNRRIGEALTPLENALLDILCSGVDSGSSIARMQRAIATWGGYEHDGCDCFLISIASTNEIPSIEHEGGPFAVAEVSDGMETLGLLELWVVDGLLHSVNYMPFGDEHVTLPVPDEYMIMLIDSE